MIVHDAHLHVVDPARFPYRPEAGGYVPGPDESGAREALVGTLDAHGVTGGVVVQPSGYGFDNGALLDALERGGGRFRGVAVVDPERTSPPEAERLRRAGVVGCRLNLLHGGRGSRADDASLASLFRFAAEQDWLVEIACRPDAWPGLERAVRGTPVRLVVGHFAMGAPNAPHEDFHLRPMFEAAEKADAHVKLSAPYRVSGQGPPWSDLGPLTRRLLAVLGPERLVWGSDWPYVNVDARRRSGITYAGLLSAARDWIGDDAAARHVFGTAPERLFGLTGA